MLTEKIIKNKKIIPLCNLKRGACSVVITHYNAPFLLIECVNSVISQLEENDEVIIVDDKSQVESVEIIISYIKGVSDSIQGQIKLVVNSENLGPGMSRNKGANCAKNKYIQFLDGDDCLNYNSLDVSVKYLDSDNQIHAVSGIMQAFGTQYHQWVPKDNYPEIVFEKNPTHVGFMIRKEVFHKLDGFSIDKFYHYEDWEFMIRFTLQGMKLKVIPLVTYFYRVSCNTKSRTNSFHMYESYSKIRIIESALSKKISPDVIPSLSRVLQYLVLNYHNLSGNIHSPLQASLQIEKEKLYVDKSKNNKFSGIYNIDSLSFNDDNLTISGWLASEKIIDKIFLATTNFEINANVIYSQRDDVVNYMKDNFPDKKNCMSFFIEISSTQLLQLTYSELNSLYIGVLEDDKSMVVSICDVKENLKELQIQQLSTDLYC